MKLEIGQKIINKIRGKKISKNIQKPLKETMSPIEWLKYYKYKGWQEQGTGEEYDKQMEKNFFNDVIKHYFYEYIKPTDKVLDIGAGTGRLSFALADIGCDVVAADISLDMLNIIEKSKGDRKIKTVTVNCEELPFADNSFDSVVSLDAMVHFVEWEKFLAEQARVVKSDGIIAFNFYNGEHLKLISEDKSVSTAYITNGDFYASATKEEMQEVCNKLGLEIINFIPYNFFHQSAFGYNYLTSEESIMFNKLFHKLRQNPRFLNLITEFETKIIKNSSPETCSSNIVVLKKASKN